MRAPLLPTALILASLALLAPTGCKLGGRSVQVPDAPLGRVIIYRNGVAYFERHATVEDELVLDVPGDRVDDFRPPTPTTRTSPAASRTS